MLKSQRMRTPKNKNDNKTQEIERSPLDEWRAGGYRCRHTMPVVSFKPRKWPTYPRLVWWQPNWVIAWERRKIIASCSCVVHGGRSNGKATSSKIPRTERRTLLLPSSCNLKTRTRGRSGWPLKISKWFLCKWFYVCVFEYIYIYICNHVSDSSPSGPHCYSEQLETKLFGVAALLTALMMEHWSAADFAV